MRSFCFIFGLALIGSALFASDQNPATKPNPRPSAVTGVVSVVRVGPDGRLVRVLTPTSQVRLSVAASPARQVKGEPSRRSPLPPALHPSSKELDELIEETSNRYQVDPLLVKSVMQVESNFNSEAISPKGAQGLMQLIPATAQRFGVSDPFDSKQNIEGGVKYLKHLQDLFPTDLRLSLAAYNAGEGAVAKYGTIPPYKETVDYVQRVHQRYSNAKSSAAQLVQTIAAETAAELQERHIEQIIDAEGRLFLRTR